MAHSLVMALTATEGSEMQAFRAFLHYFPGAAVLIDTYDTVEAARYLADRLQVGEFEVGGVRLDSGDLVSLSQQVRSLLPEVPIFASGDLDEWEIARLKREGAEIDGYGLGTRLVTGETFNGVYKLVEIDGMAVMKESSSKVTYPGRKQIFRRVDGDKGLRDRLALAHESAEPGEVALLQRVLKQGKRVQPPEMLEAIAERTRTSVESLSEQARRIEGAIAPSVEISAELQALTQTTKHQLSS
jgi:nicotinate phosphoribosyltransferase